MSRTIALLLALGASATLAACTDTATPPVAALTAPGTSLASRDAGSSDHDEPLEQGDNGVENAKHPFTFAVIGDTPYGAAKLAEFPTLVARINADPVVSFVAPVGDIKAPGTPSIFE